ncbi:eCIS core domain-containing protein [Aliiglaciecola aliphaticivorans]
MLKAQSTGDSQHQTCAAKAAKKPADAFHSGNFPEHTSSKQGGVGSGIRTSVNPLWERLASNNMPSNVIQRKCEHCEQEQEEPLSVQPKLTVSAANDVYEQEADAVANQVMSGNSSKVSHISRLHSPQASTKKDNAAARQSDSQNQQPNRLSSYVNSLNGKGSPLSTAENRFFSSRFNHSFEGVRLHTNSEANQAAKGIQAKAFTYGNHIVFNQGAYRAHHPNSMHLLAHELTHVVQQGGANGVVSKKSDDASGWIQRTPEGDLTPEQVGQDPGLLLCFILCELGVPPSIWRDLTGLLLQAVWEEYKATYSQAQASVAFRRFELAFQTYTPLKIVQLLLTFIVHGKIGLVAVRAASAEAIRARLRAMLISRGASSTAIIGAEQIARKVVIVIEVAIAAGCAVYCGSLALGRAIVELTQAAAEGIIAFAEGLEAAGEIVGSIVGGIATEIFVRPILTSLAMADVFNWDVNGLPSSTRADTVVMGLYLSSQLNGEDMDTLLTQLAKPINQYPDDFQHLISSTFAEIVTERQTLNEEPLPYTAQEILQLTPIAFIRLLNERAYLLFDQDPNDIADRMINGGVEADDTE